MGDIFCWRWGRGSGCPLDTKPRGATPLLVPFPGKQRCRNEIIGYKAQDMVLTQIYANNTHMKLALGWLPWDGSWSGMGCLPFTSDFALGL